MKKLFVIFVLWLAAMPCSAHKEWVHQYIVQEAYRYLEKQVGAIPALRDYVGVNYQNSGNDFYGWAKYHPKPWELPAALAVGVWREDVLDPVWGYYGPDGAYVGTTHFWSAQDGDNNNTQFNSWYTPNNENAFLKARNYMNNGLNLTGIHGLFIDGKYLFKVNGPLAWGTLSTNGVQMEYQDLCDLIINGNCNVTKGYYLGLPHYLAEDRQNYFSDAQAKVIGYNIFGHILHLLGDMSVPAHTHADSHPCDDTYELVMGDNLQGGCNDEHTSFLAQNWTSTSAANQGGLLLEYFPCLIKMHFVICFTQ